MRRKSRNPLEENLKLQTNEISKECMMLQQNLIPIFSYLDNLNFTTNDLLDFSNLLKSHSLRDKKHSNIDTNERINKKDFTSIFKTLFEKTKDENSIFQRPLDRMNYTQRNILFAYFSLKYTDAMHEIANNFFNDFEFNNKINNKVDLSTQWHKYVDDLQKIKNDPITFVDFANNFIYNENDDYIVTTSTDEYDAYKTYREIYKIGNEMYIKFH